MKTNQLFTAAGAAKTIGAAMFAAAMLFGSSAVFAQVKVGTNPTTIDPANNLEVEASTSGRKTSIDKTTGQVTIKDGTEGTKKVLTSDLNGVASWQTVEQTSTVQTKVNFAANVLAGGNNLYVLTFGSPVFDLGNNVFGDFVKIPSSGLYDISSTVMWNSSFPSGSASNAMYLYVNGGTSEQLSGAQVVNGITTVGTGRAIVRLLAGDLVGIATLSSQTGGTYSIIGGKFAVLKLSN